MIKETEQLGKHFLVDKNVLKKIIDFANVASDDIILEIGTGKGILTKELLKTSAKKIISVEMNYSMKKEIEKNLDVKSNKLELIYGNGLDSAREEEYTQIIANLPYHICEPLFKKILKKEPDSCVLLIGKNFWDVLQLETKIGIPIRAVYDLELIESVSPESFNPPPRVQSVLIKMKKKEKLTSKDALVKEVFQQDDKYVANAARNALKKVLKMTGHDAGELVKKIIPDYLAKKRIEHLSNQQTIILDKIIEKEVETRKQD